MLFTRLKKGKILVAVSAFMALMMVFSVALPVEGSKSSIRDKIRRNEKNIKSIKRRLAAGRRIENRYKKQSEKIADKISVTKGSISDINDDMEKTQKKIKKAQKALNDAIKKVEDQEGDLGGRLRNMYKSGSIGFVDLLLGSGDISDFILNFDMVQRIYSGDKDLLKQLEDRENEVKTKKADLDRLKLNLAEQKKDLQAKKAQLSDQKAEADKKKTSQAKLNKKFGEDLEAMRRDSERLASILNPPSGGGGTTIPSEFHGPYQWPVPGHRLITSPYGPRSGVGVGSFHLGIDISCPTGSSIVASKKGRVISAGYMGSYGNLVVVDHGGGMATAYAHNSSIKVRVGQMVSKGQVLALSGMTGAATGPHCHFEVRKNGTAVNPMSYLR